MTSPTNNDYYLPGPSSWPIKGSIALFVTFVGVANWLHNEWFGPYLTAIGTALLIYLVYGWFGTVVKEDRQGLLASQRMDRSYRLSMMWFIFSEVSFFSAFFAALFYARLIAIPALGGTSSTDILSHLLLWPGFNGSWPLLNTPDPSQFTGPRGVMETWGIPALNTLILLTSGVTITIAHWALLKNKRTSMLLAQATTILLGIFFLFMQAKEYGEAYMHKGLTLASGIYGTTFFTLTGFHGLHVTIGTIGLMVIFYRMLKRDFSEHHHFAFEGIAWYWHFVDVVWLFLFIFVYWL
ncbi:MAG: cytochrome c oxidase subunit 3 [Gammaproteobacteria bacterium]